MIKKIIDWLDSYFSKDEDIFIEELENRLKNKNIEISILKNENTNLLNTTEIILEENKKLLSLFTEGWNNPYNWTNYRGNFETISGLKIPPNTTITPNDKKIKSTILREKLKKSNIKDTAIAIEKFIHSYIMYLYDEQNPWHPKYKEYFQPAAFTYASKLGDCDDFAILFQTMMHICGYGKESYVDCSMATWHNGQEIGHAYNRVLINGEWNVFDANAGPKNKKKCIYPNKKSTWFHFNYYGTFIW